MTRERHAFTLIELLIVVMILGILAAITVPQFSDAGSDARLGTLKMNLNIVRHQIELYRHEHNGALPTLTSFVAQLTGKTDVDGSPNSTGRLGPYLPRIPNNPFTVGGSGTDVTNDPAGADKAWYYDETTGAFRANDGGATNGVTHDSL